MQSWHTAGGAVKVPRGWARVISPALHGDMLALNGSSLTLHLPPQPRYDVHAPETISVQLPAAALRSGRPLVVNGTEMEALVAYVADASQGSKVAVPQSHPEEKAAYKAGEALFYHRAGPYDFSCAT